MSRYYCPKCARLLSRRPLNRLGYCAQCMGKQIVYEVVSRKLGAALANIENRKIEATVSPWERRVKSILEE